MCPAAGQEGTGEEMWRSDIVSDVTGESNRQKMGEVVPPWYRLWLQEMDGLLVGYRAGPDVEWLEEGRRMVQDGGQGSR